MEFTKRVSKSKQITIPAEILDAYDIKPHDLVVFDCIKVIKK